MVKKLGKILTIGFALFGVVQLTSLAFPGLKNLIFNPKVVNTPMVKGAIDYANQVLPETQQIKIPEFSPDPITNQKTITGIFTEKVTEKVNETASEAVDAVKEEASDQVCKALYQKLESECGSFQ